MGGCVCGKARYSIAVEPATVYACHCTDCQKRSGSAFGLAAIVPEPTFRLETGATHRWERKMATATYVWFRCSECGTNLYGTKEGVPEIVALWPGTLDDPSSIKPQAHFWVRSAQPWFKFSETDVVFETQPDDLSQVHRS
ncbi:MAG: GFA family protein [Gammaproteobacteria bacterium]